MSGTLSGHQRVDSTIENSLFEFSNASIGADQLRDTQSNNAWGGAMQGLVSAEGASQSSQSTATRTWTRGIATAYQAGAAGGAFFQIVASPYGSGANPVSNLLLTAATDEDAEIDHETIVGLDPNHPSNAGTGGGNTLPDPVQAGTDFHNAANTADDTLDQANADAEDDRVAAVTGVRDGLDTALETADVTWGGTMDTAGAVLGSALDGIQDFDWQHVRNYVGAVTGARRAAELGALTAQVGFVSSYTGAVNSYTASIATSAVTHTTLYAQATADYYVDTAEQEALAAESAVTTAIAGGASQSEIDTLTATAIAKRAKATAFATFATSYVTYLTTEAQSAATTAVANVTSANTTALATIITAVATATTDINTFYDNQIATAANPPPVDTDLDNDGITDPPAPTATQSITASINAAKTANTTARTVVHTAFNSSVIPRTTSSTQTIPTSNAGGGGMSGGGGSNSGGGIPNVTPPITPSGGNGLGSLGPDTSPLQNMIDRMQEQMIDSETGQERGGISNELALGPAGAMGIANGIAAAVEPAAVGFTRGGPGHHWVPFAVFEKFFSDGLISEETRELLNTYLTNPPYDHGFDTWSDGVDLWTHAKYNDSVAEIMTELTKGNKQLNLDKAKALAEFLKTGSEAEWAKLGLDSAAKSRLKGALDAIAGWRKGFFNSIREAQAAILILEEQGIKFTKPEIKAFARRQVNGSVADTGGKLAKEASRITDAINAIKKKGAVGLAKLAEIMKKSTYVAGALIIFAGFLDKTLQAKDVIWGFTGNGKKHIGRDGKEYQHAYLLGAVDTWGYNFIMGQELEGVGAALRDLAPGALPVLVVPADNLQRRMAQGGLTLDMEPGFFTPPKPTAPKPSGGGFWSWWWGR